TALGELAVSDPALVIPLASRLLWFMNEESSTVGWGSAQAIGEIYRRNPGAAREQIRAVVHYMDDEELSMPGNRNTYLLSGSIWTIGNIAEMDRELSCEMGPALTEFLSDPDPQVRGLTAWALGKIKYEGALDSLEGLLTDQSEIELYADGELKRNKISHIAKNAIDKIKEQKMKEVKKQSRESTTRDLG
ncbi:MAG: DVU0298 family protein, partial [Nitrospirota bacterium]